MPEPSHEAPQEDNIHYITLYILVKPNWALAISTQCLEYVKETKRYRAILKVKKRLRMRCVFYISIKNVAYE